MEFGHPQDLTAETEDDDETLLFSDIVLSDGSLCTMNATRKLQTKGSVALISLIVISSIIFIGSVTVVGVFSVKQSARNKRIREQQQQESNNGGVQILLTRFPTLSPTNIPSFLPSDVPSVTPTTSAQPSNDPSSVPSSPPSAYPTTAVTRNTTTFYAVGDSPYTNDQAIGLLKNVRLLPDDADFFVHLGDLRKAGEKCVMTDYRRVAAILQESRVPVFVVLGDNDWNDCPNMKHGLKMWKQEFLAFDQKHWSVPWAVERQKGREENFTFELKGTLFIGLNLVGGDVHSTREWKTRLGDQAKWTIGLVRKYTDHLESKTGRVVLFGHADPSSKHDEFFGPVTDFIGEELANRVPVLYMNGDSHHWSYDPVFMNQESLLRIMVTGRSVDPPLQVVVTSDGKSAYPTDAFVYDRRLD